MQAVLIIITSDPRQSGRAAEAIRIAAGLTASGKLEVVVYLRAEAALALEPEREPVVEEESFLRYLPQLAEGRAGRVLTEAGNRFLFREEPAICRYEEIGDEDLAQLATRSQIVMRF